MAQRGEGEIPYPHGEATRTFLAQQLYGKMQELPVDMGSAFAESLGRQTRAGMGVIKKNTPRKNMLYLQLLGYIQGNCSAHRGLCCAFPGEMSHPERGRVQLTSSWEGRKSSGIT